jgi:hypothetical protein
MQGIRTGFIGLALSSVIVNASAAELCATAQDLTAMQVAAVQQKLMVAALSCNNTAAYNDFVAAYQPDLVASDQALQAFFMRLNADTGASDYDSFKTKLANTASMRSSGNTRNYCRTAQATFKAALGERRQSLRSFVLAEPMLADARYAVCGETIAGGSLLMAPVQAAVAAAPEIVPGKPTTQAAVAAASGVAVAKAADAVTPNAAVTPTPPAATAGNRNDNLYRYPNGTAPQQQRARPYATRDPRDAYIPAPYRQGYNDNYGYTNRYGERDPYYRNPYSRPQYSRVPPEYYYYYLRRR